MNLQEIMEGGVEQAKNDFEKDHHWAKVKMELKDQYPERMKDADFISACKVVCDRLIDWHSDPLKTLMRTTKGSRSKALELLKGGVKDDWLAKNEKVLEEAFDIVLSIFNGGTEVEWHTE